MSDYRDVGGQDAFGKLIPNHQNKNRSVGSAVLQGFIDIDAPVTMLFEPQQEGKIRRAKTITIRDVMGKLYNKISGRKFSVFLYCFRNFRGQYLWFGDKVPEMREFTTSVLKVLAVHMWHMMHRWGWDLGCCKHLFKKSFDSETATNAMNSKWNPHTQRVVQVEMGTAAAAHLAFGQSPFILKEGEEMKPASAKKVQIKHSDLGPEDMGGIDLDDLASVGDQSNAITVMGGGDSDAHMDGVSELEDNDGFEGEEEEDEENSCGKSTKAGADDDERFKCEEEFKGTAAFVPEDNSAYETRASKHSNTVQYYESELEWLKFENSANLSAMVCQMEETRQQFEEQMAMMRSQRQEGGPSSVGQRPEATGMERSGSSSSQNGPHGSAPNEHE